MKEKGIFDALTFYGTENGYSRATINEVFKTIALRGDIVRMEISL
jgi:hypothetical protein